MQPTYDDWTLVSLSPLPGAVQLVLALVVLGVVGLIVWRYRGSKRRLWLSSFRVLAGLMVLGMLTEPALQLRAVRKIRNRLAVVLDRSLSMTLPAEGGTTRYDRARTVLDKSSPALRKLAESHDIGWFDLDGPLTDTQMAAPPAGESSDLLRGLELAKNAGVGRPLAGMLLISDGADSAELEGPERGELSDPAVERLKSLGVPVSTVNAAMESRFADVAIVDVRADEFAFVHNTIEIEVVLEAAGFDGATAPVTLKRGGDLLATQEVQLQGGKQTKLTFKTKPDKIGEFVYVVSVPPTAGETITSNNEQSFVLQVIRDKIRVLQVAGRPSWDERFLRQHLKENPNVDLVSFFILRTPTDNPMASENELSLIPFPVERLFTTELASFDVIIFQNFDYRPYQMERYLPNIATAVKGGLGFVMLGGDQSFGGGGYVGTEIEDIVPVSLDQAGLVTGVASPTLTDAGRRHPVTDLSRGGSNERLWQTLPPWVTFNRIGRLLNDATALAVHPQIRGADGKPMPLIAVKEVGEGRSIAISTDSMWRWRISSQRDGGAAQRAFHRFWGNALRWLMRDPELARVQVAPQARAIGVGQDIDVSFTVRGPDYQPVRFAQLKVTLEHNVQGALKREELTTGEAGVSRLKFRELPAGAYRVAATAAASGQNLGTGEGVFVVEARSAELTRAAPRPDLLTEIASATGGRAMTASAAVWEDVEVVDPEMVEIDRRRNVELWDNAWALVAVCLILAADWALRRRSGYL